VLVSVSSEFVVVLVSSKLVLPSVKSAVVLLLSLSLDVLGSWEVLVSCVSLEVELCVSVVVAGAILVKQPESASLSHPVPAVSREQADNKTITEIGINDTIFNDL